MKIALIQSGNQGFFPRFYNDLSKAVEKRGDILKLFVPNTGVNNRRKLSNQIIWGNRFNWPIHYYLYRLTGLQDVWSFFSTMNLVRKLKEYSPDVINLHVVNDCNLCMPLLVRYINKHAIPVVWTFHDTRAFTGRCANFDEVNCEKWKTGCYNCPKDNLWFTKSLIDNSRLEWIVRRKLFNAISKLTIVTPSEWLADFVRDSFFKDKNIVVVNNGIDTCEFSKKRESSLVNIQCSNKKIILGVASVWNKSKGLDTMLWLSQQLNGDYQIVLLGRITDEQKKLMPNNILCLPPTSTKDELIAIYQKADVFVNPTLADNFPTVNIEALASGLPVITYKTGGSAECLNEKCGIAVDKGDRQALLKAIYTVCAHPEVYTKENSIKRSQNYSLAQFDKYVELYHQVSGK